MHLYMGNTFSVRSVIIHKLSTPHYAAGGVGGVFESTKHFCCDFFFRRNKTTTKHSVTHAVWGRMWMSGLEETWMTPHEQYGGMFCFFPLFYYFWRRIHFGCTTVQRWDSVSTQCLWFPLSIIIYQFSVSISTASCVKYKEIVYLSLSHDLIKERPFKLMCLLGCNT